MTFRSFFVTRQPLQKHKASQAATVTLHGVCTPWQHAITCLYGLLCWAGTTTNQDAYKAYAVQPREVHHVDYKYAPVPFEGETEAHAQYKQWELEKRPPPPPAPIRASLPFEGE